MDFLGRIRIKSFNIEPTNRCILACSECARTNNAFIKKNPVDISLAAIQNAFPLAHRAELAGLKVNLCGAVGDAIYHKNLHPVLEHLKAAGITVELETNGSYRSKEWWERTVSILSADDTVTFSVDGLRDTNHIYRKNSKWDDIEWAMRFCATRVRVHWKFIVFKHNEHQIEDIKAFAAEIGVHSVTFKKSSRFREQDELAPLAERYIGVATRNRRAIHTTLHGAPGERDNALIDSRVIIKPKCFSGKNIAITATGYIFPCTSCEIHSHGNWFGDNKEAFNLNRLTIFEIINSPKWQELEGLWTSYSRAPEACRSYCAAHVDFIDEIDRNARPDRENRPEDSETYLVPA